MAERITFALRAARSYRDPYVGILLARINPEHIAPEQGADLRLPAADDLLRFDRRLGGQALPQDEETAALIALYHTRRKPRGT